jgi:chromosome segregation ATPase
MGNINAIFGKYKAYAIIAVLAALLGLAGMRACKIGDSYSRLEGEYATLKKIAAADHVLHMREIEKVEAEKKKLDEDIQGLMAKVEIKDRDARELGGRIASLEAEYRALGNDKDGQIENLKSQVKAWSERFSLVMLELEDKDKIIFDLKQKYDFQVQITMKWQADYAKQTELQKILEANISSLKGKLRMANFKSNLKTYLVIAIAGYAGYQAIKGK